MVDVIPTLSLPALDIERYSRHLILKGWSAAKQIHIAALHVAIPIDLPSAALYLAALGVMRLTFLDKLSINPSLVNHLRAFRPDLELLEFGFESSNPPHCVIEPSFSKNAAYFVSIPIIVQTTKEGVQLIEKNSCGEKKILFNIPHLISMSPLSEIVLPKHLLVGIHSTMLILKWWSNVQTNLKSPFCQ